MHDRFLVSDVFVDEYEFCRLCETGKSQQVRFDIDSAADVNVRNSYGQTALMCAVMHNPDIEVVKLLLEKGADENARSCKLKRTVLMYASTCNSKAVAVLIECGVDVNARNTQRRTALMLAAGSGKESHTDVFIPYYQSVESITALLRAGADVNARDYQGQTALMFAARNNRNPKVFSALLEAGADITAQTHGMGTTALMWAAELGKNAEVISLLLKAGADPRQKNKRGCIALDFAEYNHALRNSDALLQLRSVSLYRDAADYMRRLDRMEFCRLCGAGTPRQVKAAIDAKSNVRSRDHNNYTPLMRAARDNTSEVVRLLLDAGADVNEEDYGMSSLMLAVIYNEDVDVLRVLIERGADVNAKHGWGKWTALFYSVDRRMPEVMKLLIDAGADVNAQREYGDTPLMYAVSKNSPEVVKLLIDSGADVNAKNGYGKTPLAFVRRDSPEILELLTEAMANNSSDMTENLS